jgi:virulence-associated protein VapD
MEIVDDAPLAQTDETVVNIDINRRRKIHGVLDMMNVNNFSEFDTSWRELALCKDRHDFVTDDFFYVTITRKNIHRILAIQELCKQCPVAANCLHEAMMFNYDGCWAGYTNQQRTAYIRSERYNSVQGLTVDECASILAHLNTVVEKPATRAARRAAHALKPSV